MPAGPFAVSADSLNRHVFVCGATGAGKSQTVRCLLEAATERGIPWLVVEPAKAEYRLMASRLPGTRGDQDQAGRAGRDRGRAQPARARGRSARAAGFPLQTHADLVKALFIASFQAEEPFPQVLSAALGRVYEEAGWDLALGEPGRLARPAGQPGEAAYPTLTVLQRAAERVVAEIGYSQRVTDDVLGFIRVRLASLRHGTTGRFLEGGHPLDFGALLRRNVVLEIEDVGDDADKAFLMGTVLIRLAEHLRLTHRAAGRAAGLAHLTVVEEAHRLLRRPEPRGAGGAGAAGHAVELFAGLLAEIRAYGEGLVIAEQIPARLVPDVIKNTAVKITHRLPAADDREAVGATMNATPRQSRYLVTLPPGQAAVFADGMDFPVLVQVKDGIGTGGCFARRAPPMPATVVRPRSGSCGSECLARPCTLREMRGGQRAARRRAAGPAVGGTRGARAPDRLADAGARADALAACPAGASPGPARLAQCAARPRGRRGRGRAPGGHRDRGGRTRRARGGGDPRAGGAPRVALPPDEPEWLLGAELTEEAVLGVNRPAVLAAAGHARRRAADLFIDCQWALDYLRAGSPCGSRDGAKSSSRCSRSSVAWTASCWRRLASSSASTVMTRPVPRSSRRSTKPVRVAHQRPALLCQMCHPGKSASSLRDPLVPPCHGVPPRSGTAVPY